MTSGWIEVYQGFGEAHSDPVAQSGYMADGKSVGEGYIDDWFSYVQSELAVQPGEVVLDVGCGSGLFLRRFQAITPRLYGVEPAASLVEAARKNAPAATVKSGDVLHAEFDGVRPDVVVCNSVFLLLGSLDEAREALGHFLRLIAPGGRIWLGDMPRPTAEMAPGSDYRRRTRAVALDNQHFPPELLEAWCTQAGASGRKIEQRVPNKPNSQFRYDFLVERR